ncbi:MAG: hypothetical protein OXC72_00725 [Roseovarius sp.]|nr:hypothetical protein [Roseovarius sp.]MCY4314690.1 hypothetical protein [Roseovarius sp.]
MGQRNTRPFDDRSFFADAMKRDLEAQLAEGAALIAGTMLSGQGA